MAREPHVPPEFPLLGAESYRTVPIGRGTRMVAYPAYSDTMVLRVPRTTEAELVSKYGASDRYATAGTEHPVSQYTLDEMIRYINMKSLLGRFTVGVIPIHALDQRQQLRTYAVQRRIHVEHDLLAMEAIVKRVLDDRLAAKLRNFIEDIRKMILEINLVPDLCGNNNSVIDANRDVWLIDVNNIRPFIPDAAWLKPEFRGREQEALLRAKRWYWLDRYSNGTGDDTGYKTQLDEAWRELKEVLADGYLDDRGLPVGDSSIAVLSRWEKALGMQTDESLTHDELYSICLVTNLTRRKVLGYFNKGGLPPDDDPFGQGR